MSASDRRPGALRLALLAVAVVLACVPPAPAAGQDRRPAPLSRDDLERLLTGDTYARSEIVEIIERSCLSFDPGALDLRELRELGADDAIVSAIEACAARARAPVVATLSTGRLESPPGGLTRLTVRALRAGEPVPGTRLVLQGSELIPGGPDRPLTATTDAAGRAVFRVPVGTVAGEHRLRVTGAGGALGGRTEVALVVSPGPAVRARVDPTRVRLIGVEPVELRAIAYDRWGNRVPGAPLTLVARPLVPGQDESPPFPETTRDADETGTARFIVEPSPELRRFTLEVHAGDGTPLAVVPVSVALALLEGEAGETPPAGEPPAGETPPDPEARGEEAPPGGQAGAADRAGRAGEEGAAAETDDPERAAVIAERRRMAAQALADGEAARAVAWYEGLASLAPDDPGIWLELGRARAARGDHTGARRAFARARAIDPTLAERVATELRALDPLPPWIEIDVWGGTAIETGATSGHVMAQATVRPLPFLHAWGRYDDAIGLHNPIFVRRVPDLRSYWGGAGIDWGVGRRLTTSFEVGRRDQSDDLYEYVYHGEQAVRWGRDQGRLAVGGYLGRWHDRDDWVGYALLDVGVVPGFGVRPALWVGETVTSLDDSTRLVESEVRGYLGLVLRPAGPLQLEPSLGVGSVDGEDDALDGTLLDARLRVIVSLGGPGRLQLFARHQRPPGGEPFSAVAAGLGLAIGPATP